tara:strand:+ start:301 stop:1515 length:1215 start_codon:yes stop_codon:yes gene_type:complete
MIEKVKKSKRIYFILIILIAGIIFRLTVASRGYNWDMECWMVCAEIMENGGNVYAETYRYTYGPIWFNILHIIEKLTNPSFPDEANLLNFQITSEIKYFRYTITMFLTFIDLGLFIILLKLYGLRIAAIFFLNPVTIILTGYHSQHDNVGILVGLCSMLVHGNVNKGEINLRFILGLFLLGFSLMIKHIFIFFPFWLSLKQNGLKRKVLTLVIPIMIFLTSFIPYWDEGKINILNWVFLYSGWEHAPFWRLFFPYVINYIVPPRHLFIISMLFMGFIFRKINIWDSIIIYTACIVILSSGVGNQYYAIIMPFICINLNWSFIISICFASYHLLTSLDALHIQVLREITPVFLLQSYNYYYITIFLVIGFLWTFYSVNITYNIKNYGNKFKIYIKNELSFQRYGD